MSQTSHQTTHLTITPPTGLALFGGGAMMLAFALEAKQRGIMPAAFSVPRQLDEILPHTGMTLEASLQQQGISCYREDDINQSQALRQFLADHTGTVVGVGLGEAYTFDKEVLAGFNRQLFDFMVIRMPQYRGGAHFTWQILRGNRIGAWNIQRINEEMVPGVYDSGEILVSHEFMLPASARIPADFFVAYDAEILVLFKQFLNDIAAQKTFPLTRLQENFSTYFPRLHTVSQGYIDWRWSATEIERFICAFDDPYPGASTFCNQQRLFLKQAQQDPSEGAFHPFMAGLVYRMHGDTVFVATRDGGLAIQTVLDEAGRDIKPYLKPGQRLWTPQAKLDEAMAFTAEYGAAGLVPA